jgi:hypothetical protein
MRLIIMYPVAASTVAGRTNAIIFLFVAFGMMATPIIARIVIRPKKARRIRTVGGNTEWGKV